MYMTAYAAHHDSFLYLIKNLFLVINYIIKLIIYL